MTDQIEQVITNVGQRIKNPKDPLSKLLRLFAFLMFLRIAAQFCNAAEFIQLAHPIDVSFLDPFLYSIFTSAMALVDPSAGHVKPGGVA